MTDASNELILRYRGASDSREVGISLNQLLLVLITALVTGAFSFTGLWIGARLTRGNEDRKWRRDQALEAYSEFLSAAEMAISEAGMAYGAHCGTEDHTKHCEAVMDKVADMHRLSGRIILLAPDALEAPFSALTEFITSELLIMAIQCQKASPDERKVSNKKLAGLMANFMLRARHDIGIHPPLGTLDGAEKPWWQFWR
jgi:hypothetical protein